MRDSNNLFGGLDNYPPGAKNDPNAPYNRVETPIHEFDVDITCVLFGNGKFESDEYTGGCYDDMGDMIPKEYCGTYKEEVMWEEQNYTPKQLLEEYANVLESDLSSKIELINRGGHVSRIELDGIRKRIRSCKMWTDQEIEKS